MQLQEDPRGVQGLEGVSRCHLMLRVRDGEEIESACRKLSFVSYECYDGCLRLKRESVNPRITVYGYVLNSK